jgi:hypothetical protein
MLTALVALALLAAPDIGVDSIIQPRGQIPNQDTTMPSVQIGNHGDRSSNFTVWLTVFSAHADVYSESLVVGDLAAGTDTVLSFPGLDPGTLPSPEDCVVCCSLYAADDSSRANDVQYRDFTVWIPI